MDLSISSKRLQWRNNELDSSLTLVCCGEKTDTRPQERVSDQVSRYFIILYFSLLHHCRLFNTFIISHYQENYFIPMTDDQKLEADQLPSGFVPLWFDIKKKGEMSQREILEKISELEEIAGLSVTVLYSYDEDFSAKQFCDEIKWKYRKSTDMKGCEDEAVIVLDRMHTESISRPHKLLVMVTTADSG